MIFQEWLKDIKGVDVKTYNTTSDKEKYLLYYEYETEYLGLDVEFATFAVQDDDI